MLTLRPIHADDIEAIRLWRNAQLDVLRQSNPITREEQERYFATRVWPFVNEPQPPQILLSYFDGGRHIGYGGLVHIAWEHKRAEVSFLLDPTRAAQYCADFATFLRLIREFAFRELGLQRLFTETYAMRTEHMQVLEDAGFQPEGVMRRHVLVGGRPVDSIIHGCLHEQTD
jgi:RimJ/RimL family protein N-acetyltransferase